MSEGEAVGWWGAAGGAAAVVLSAAVSAWALARRTRDSGRRARSKVRREDRVQRLAELERVCDRQERHIQQLQEALGEFQALAAVYHEDRVGCREEVADLRGWLRTFRDGWLRWVVREGGDPSEVPELPPPRTPHAAVTEQIDFRHRTVQQTAEVLRQVPPPKDTPPGGRP